MIKRIFLGITVILAIVAFIFYNKLGGSEPLEFHLADHPDFYVSGDYYEGRYNDAKLEKLFFEAKARAQKTEGHELTIITYPSMEQGKIVRQFIGTGSLEKPDTVGLDIEMRAFPRQQIIYATINAHNAVMPTPEEVKSQAEAFAKTKNVKIDTVSIETYISERELKVIFPTQ